MKRKGRGGVRKVTVVAADAPHHATTTSSSTTSIQNNKKSIGFVHEATRQSGAGALPASEKAISISSIKVSSLPTSLRRHHEVCRFTQSLFRSGCLGEDQDCGGDADRNRSLIALPATAMEGVVPGGVGVSSADDLQPTSRSHPHQQVVPLWTVSSHLQQDQYLAMSAALDVAVSAHRASCNNRGVTAAALSPAAVLLLQEASAVFCAALPMMKSAFLDLSTLSGLRQALDLFLALIVPCRSWGCDGEISEGGDDSNARSTSNWLAWGLTFSRLGRSHTHLPQEAAQTAAACMEGSTNGWLIQCAQLWSKSLTSIEAANGAAKQANLPLSDVYQHVASPLLDRAWLDVPVGGLSGSPNIDKWRVEEAAQTASSSSSSSSCQLYTPLVVSAATFHSTLHAASSKNSRPTNPSSLSSCFSSLMDVVHNGHEPSSKYLSGLLRTVSTMIKSTTPVSITTAAVNKVADSNFLQSATGTVVLLSSNMVTSKSVSQTPVVGVKREREEVSASAAVKVEATVEDDVSTGGKCTNVSGAEWSRRELMGRLVSAMQEGEGIPPYMRYLQRLSKDSTTTPPIPQTSSAPPLFDVESIFPTLGDLPSTVVAPSLWSTSPEVLRGYGGKVQLEIQEEFLANIKPPFSSSKDCGGHSPWIYPIILWSLDGSAMAVLLRKWMVCSSSSGKRAGDAGDALYRLCTHICNNILYRPSNESADTSSLLSVAVSNRLLRSADQMKDACCFSVVVDHTLLHLLQPPSHDAVFEGLVEAAVCLEGRDVVGRVREASHGLLIWCYGGFEGMGAAIGHFPACSFKC